VRDPVAWLEQHHHFLQGNEDSSTIFSSEAGLRYGARGGFLMHKVLLVCVAVLCLSWTAAAQDFTGAFDAGTPAPAPAEPVPFSLGARDPWQLGIGFQYQHVGALDQSFNTLGYKVHFTRFVTDRFGVEGNVTFGFGKDAALQNCCARSVFIGGGPHVILHSGSRLEPWVHVLAGLQYVHLPQGTIVGSRSTVGFVGGAGLDYAFGAHTSWRVQGDFIGSHFGNSIDKSYSFGTGLVFNF
jgi:opacity protein-like surface antigen